MVQACERVFWFHSGLGLAWDRRFNWQSGRGGTGLHGTSEDPRAGDKDTLGPPPMSTQVLLAPGPLALTAPMPEDRNTGWLFTNSLRTQAEGWIGS